MVIRDRALAAKQVDAQRCSDSWRAGIIAFHGMRIAPYQRVAPLDQSAL